MSLKKLILVGLFVLLGTGIASADVIVRPGDTLSYIALDQTGRANNWAKITAVSPKTGEVRDPNLIFPGDIVVIPEELVIARTARMDTAAKSGKVSSLAKVEKTKALVVGHSTSDRVVGPTEFASQTEEPKLTVETVSRNAPVTAPPARKINLAAMGPPLSVAWWDPPNLALILLTLLTLYFFSGSRSYARATAHGTRSRQWRVRKNLSGEKQRKIWSLPRPREKIRSEVRAYGEAFTKEFKMIERPTISEGEIMAGSVKTSFWGNTVEIWIAPSVEGGLPNLEGHRKLIVDFEKRLLEKSFAENFVQKSPPKVSWGFYPGTERMVQGVTFTHKRCISEKATGKKFKGGEPEWKLL